MKLGNEEFSEREKYNTSLVRSSLHECCLFLRKNDEFPLQKPGKIAVFGNGVRHTIKGGTGSSDVNVHYITTVEEGLLNSKFKIITNDWLDAYDAVYEQSKKQFIKDVKASAKAHGVSPYMEAFGYVKLAPEYSIPLSFEGDVAIYVLSRISGEGNDRRAEKGDLFLTDTEVGDILMLNERYKKFMLVLNVAGVIDLTPVKEVRNILLLSQLGSETGNVLADILLGKVNPSGKLTDTWAAPSDYSKEIDFGSVNNTYYFEDIFVGYKYFDSYNVEPLFPFGFGLSYSEFKIEKASLELNKHSVTVNCIVTNISKFDGKEVVQIYVTEPQGKLNKVYQKLVGFSKTSLLRKNEKEKVSISINLLDLASYDSSNQRYVLEKGQYIFRIGNSSRNTRIISAIQVSNDVVVKNVRNMYNDNIINNNIKLIDDPISKYKTLREKLEPETVTYFDPFIDEKLNTLSNEQLINLVLGSQRGSLFTSFIGNSGMKVKGAAGESYSGIEDFKTLVMCDGPAGLRLSTHIGQYNGKTRDLSPNAFLVQLYDFFPKFTRLLMKKMTVQKKLKKKETLLLQYCTTLPAGTALAQSWNEEYAELCGDVVGNEMEEFNVDFWLAPGMNIHRSVLCGRNFEYYSEDPYLTGMIVSNVVKGVQAHKGKYVTLKHFACNNQEYNRFFNNSVISERALREVYLKPFEIAIKESDPGGIMSSYNLINGKHVSETKELIYDYLRCECGFDGIVMTDWVMSSTEPMAHSIYPTAMPSNVVKACGQLFMPGSDANYEELAEALIKKKITREDLLKAATPLLNFINKD